MRYLLDTHIFLWWANGDKKLKVPIRELLAKSQNTIFVSTITAWEISIKLKAKPNFKLQKSLKRTFLLSKFGVMPVTFSHVLTLHQLPMYHKDPFDRMLIAQAKTEKLKLITSDSKIWKYNLSLLKA
ncbi:MAG: type II toxin-antitoxin system VapC family toxin [Candidatus Blackburnbacteria bacterium]|nr:type II toxin-antitoxin system VapC family toxin [Candidatus Blackburnbacteria bacterium]